MRKIVALIPIGLLLLFSGCLYEDSSLYDANVIISGKVLNAETLEPVYNARVEATLVVASSVVCERPVGTSICKTDKKGRFTIVMDFDDSYMDGGGYYYVNYVARAEGYLQKEVGFEASTINILLSPL
ncbi:MAG TPA: hypothetical protein VK202_08645 [Bacteroidia bacterium]|nr:hypothetical protein [Bacteroidia bacterium]